MKTKLIYALIVLFSLGFFSCSEDPVVESEGPYIDLATGDDEDNPKEREK